MLITFFSFSGFLLSRLVGLGLLSLLFPSFGEESVSPSELLESACEDLLDEGELLVVDSLHDWSTLGIFTMGLEAKTSSTARRVGELLVFASL